MSTLAQRAQLGPFFSAGAIQGGAKLYHYEAGTSTLKNIWEERTQITTLAQPFVADANGIFNFFADGLYKLIICGPSSTGPSDQVLYTLDNWQFLDPSDPTFAEGTAVPSASTTAVGPEVWTHVTGSTDIDIISGTIPFCWLVFDGNLTLKYSASLLLPEAQDRKVRTGEVGFFLNEGSGVWRLAGYWQPGKQTDIASASTITAPTHGSMVDITGTADINAITASHAGHEFTARFTGAGLNMNHGASFLMPHGFDYRTIENEVCRFIAVTASIWVMCQMSGPRTPVGATIEDNSTTPLAGYLEEDGGAISRADYSGLYARVGTVFGVGDGSTTFNKPDSRGRAAINVDGSANRITAASTNGGNADTLGGAGGAETHTLVTSEMPAHAHTGANLDGVGFAYGTDTATAFNSATGSTGGGGAHSNTQPWIAKKKYIRF